MFYGQTEPVDSISELCFAIGPTAVEIYSEELLIDKYQLQSIIRYWSKLNFVNLSQYIHKLRGIEVQVMLLA